eukprot:TRINITY_DN60202_c0_g1_i2.p1 TRINITY_DN60202_c0_g1~~TRINITY_DN60202_c0_g1_i2.p1  ORF type:complete len:183 (+),score=32.47 TRINITY_DN60202_c0_g1_i2:142-690(+)
MIRRPPRSTLSSSSAASDVYKRQVPEHVHLAVRPIFYREQRLLIIFPFRCHNGGARIKTCRVNSQFFLVRHGMRDGEQTKHHHRDAPQSIHRQHDRVMQCVDERGAGRVVIARRGACGVFVSKHRWKQHRKHQQHWCFLHGNCLNPVLCVDTTCLLYTSDAADEEDSVDLGGRRIIKKKKMI